MIPILISPGRGAGWSTWNDVDYWPLFDPDVIELVKTNQYDKIEAFVKANPDRYGEDFYTPGYADLIVEYLVKGTRFTVTSHEGFERLITTADLEHTA